MVAIANIDEVITIIKKSKDPKIAAEALVKKQWKAGPVEAILKKVGKDMKIDLMSFQKLVGLISLIYHFPFGI